MKTNRTNKTVLVQGIKTMGLCLFFLFLDPTVLHVAFSNQEKPLYIPLLILGLGCSGAAIYFGFNGLKTIVNSMFKDS